LEAVCLLFRALDETQINRMFQANAPGAHNQIRTMAAGALYYVGAADYNLAAALLNFTSRHNVTKSINRYQDLPRAIRDPWEETVRELAYFWRNEPNKAQHKRAGVVAWNRLPEIVKWVADNRWQRKIIITGPMLTRLRMIGGLAKYEPPGWDCPMCRKLERRELLNRSVLSTRKRARAILCYRINAAGRRILERLDAAKPQRSRTDDQRADRPDAAAAN
jgi:hypothetical protein